MPSSASPWLFAAFFYWHSLLALAFLAASPCFNFFLIFAVFLLGLNRDPLDCDDEVTEEEDWTEIDAGFRPCGDA